LPFAKAVKAALDIPVILVGGMRSTGQMTQILRAKEADFIAAARPYIREPDFPRSLRAGRQGLLDCVSCNICLKHDGIDSLNVGARMQETSPSTPTIIPGAIEEVTKSIP
jgi:2,4-dienoyl-CoA reductase-like NADH-dependent reductase (Old Yellow Enzyme family)